MLTVRYVTGQAGNPAGHITVQVDKGKEVGFGPVKDMTHAQILENKNVPGKVESRAEGTEVIDAVTVHLTAKEAQAAQTTIDARVANPGSYRVDGRSCVDFGEAVIRSTGARAPSDLLPSHLVKDIRSEQESQSSSEAP